MRRLALLLGLYYRIRMRGLLSSGSASVFGIVGALIAIAFSCAMGAGAYVLLAQARSASPDRVADLASLVLSALGVLAITRPLILSSFAGSSLQNLLHLPIRHGELLGFSFLTGVIAPLLMESPVLIGMTFGAARSPGLALVTLPLAILTHLTLLALSHAMSLAAIVLARRAWISDIARVLAFSVFLLPSLVLSSPVRGMLGPFLPTLLLLSPFGWAGRATIHAGAGDLRTSAPWAILAILFIAATVAAALALLNRILAGDGVAPGVSARARPRRARVLLPGVLGAMIETQLRTQLRTPAARMALITPMLMMGLFTWSFTRRTGASFNPAVMVAILCLVGPSALLTVGRGVTLVLGTPASRAAMLMASDVSSLLFRLPPILAIVGVTAWRLGASSAIAISALGIVLLTVSSGVQHFPAILSPVALPRDRLNPFAQRTDARQAGNQVRSFLALFLAVTLSAPFAFLLWLGPRVVNGSFAFPVTALAIVGAFATYAVLIALAERLLIRRERAVLEVLLDDASG